MSKALEENLRNGMKVRYAHPHNGYETERQRAKELLELGAVYVVQRFFVDRWRTEIWLEGFDQPFNSVFFAAVRE
jgi:hypothetical protein